MCNPESERFAEKREVEGSATVGFDVADSHLVQQLMVSGNSLFGGRVHIFGNFKKVYKSTAVTESR